MNDRKLRDEAENRFASMWRKRGEREADWMEWRDIYAPSRGRFTPDERPKKSALRRNSAPMKILDEFAAGMLSGLASPSRQWFTLSLNNTRTRTLERVKAWVGQCTEIMTSKLLLSNFYDQYVDYLKEQGFAGTSAMFIEEDDEEIFTCRTLTIGQYAIDADHKGGVNRFCRKVVYTARQLADDFGERALPEEIRDSLKNSDGGMTATYEVRHLIQPNGERETAMPGAPGMKYQSLWWLASDKNGKFLRKSGYNEFPVIAGRWKVIGDDIYGREHPGELARDDAVTLQELETDARAALEKSVRPPMIAPKNAFMKNLDIRPNRVNLFTPEAGQEPHVRPLFDMRFDYEAAEVKIASLKAQMERLFYVDLFRMWASDLRSGRTATEIQAREAEKAFIMAPVTMRQTYGGLDQVINRVFRIMYRAGLFPPAPPELAGQELRIEYQSEFALLQKRTSQAGLESLLVFAERVAGLQAAAGSPPEVVDTIDGDEIMEVVSEMHAIPPGVVRGDDSLAAIREDRAMRMAQAQQAQMTAQAAELAPGAAQAAKTLSETDMTRDNSALQAVTNAVNRGTGA
jgi:hypothetical protein